MAGLITFMNGMDRFVMLLMQRSDKEYLPGNFTTLEELWEFWDTHCSADHEDQMEAVVLDLDPASSTVYAPVARDLVSKVRAQATSVGAVFFVRRSRLSRISARPTNANTMPAASA